MIIFCQKCETTWTGSLQSKKKIIENTTNEKKKLQSIKQSVVDTLICSA